MKIKCLVALIAVLFMLQQGSQAAPDPDVNIELNLRGSFFRPGSQPSHIRSENEIKLGPVVWRDQTHALVEFQVWWLRGQAAVETDEGRRGIRSLGVFPVSKNHHQDPWDFWRKKHAYVYSPEKGYAWNSLAGDKVLFDTKTGQFYDSYLKKTWSYWLLARLPEKLSGPAAQENEILTEEDSGWVKKPIHLILDPSGLIRPTPLLFKIQLWTMPVQIFFTVCNSTNSPESGLLVLQNGFKWKFDMHEWRRLHGYEKTLWGGYEWNTNFPEKVSFEKSQGILLDTLLEKSVAFWVDLAVQEVMAGLNDQLSRSAGTSKQALKRK